MNDKDIEAVAKKIVDLDASMSRDTRKALVESYLHELARNAFDAGRKLVRGA